MADRYYVGANGANWGVTSSWSTTAGGASGASVPTTADDVFFTIAGRSVNLATGANCRNMTFNVAQTITLQSFTLTCQGNFTSNNNNIQITHTTGTLRFNGSTTQTLNFGTTHTLNTNITIANGTKIFSVATTVPADKTITLDSGTIDLNNLQLTVGSLICNGTSAKAITFGTNGSILITRNSTGTALNLGAGTCTTSGSKQCFINVGASTITVIGHNANDTNTCDYTIQNGSGSVAFSGGYFFRNITIATSYSGSISGQAYTVNQNLTCNSTTATFVTNLNRPTFAGTTFDTVITLAGSQTLPGFTIDKAGRTVTLAQATTCEQNVTLNAGTLELNSFTLTCRSVGSSITTARTISFGVNGAIYITGNISTIWNTGTTTNLTITGSKQLYFNNGAGTSTATIALGSLGENSWNVTCNSSAGIMEFAASSHINNLVHTGAGAVRPVSAGVVSIYGNCTYTGTSTGASTGEFLFTGSSGTTSTINTTGSSFGFNIEINGAGKTWTITSFTQAATRVFYFQAGTIDFTNKIIYVGSFNSASSSTRQLIFGSTGEVQIQEYGVATGDYVMTGAGFSYTGSGVFRFTSQLTGDRIINATGHDINNAVDLIFDFPSISSSTVDIDFTTGSVVRNLSFIGGGYTIPPRNLTIYGDYSCTSGIQVTASTAITWTFAKPSGTQTLNATALHNIPINKTGAGTLQLLADFGTTANSTIVRNFTLTEGTIDLNNYALKPGVFNASGTTTRSVSFGTSGSIAPQHQPGTSTTTTVFDMGDPTNFSYTGTSNIFISGTGSATSTRVISTGAVTEAQALNFNINISTANVATTMNLNNANVRDLSLTLSTGPVVPATNLTLYGNCVVNAATTLNLVAGATTWTFAKSSGTQTYNVNLDLPYDIVKNGQGNLSVTGNNMVLLSKTFTHNEGTIDANGFQFQSQRFISNNSNSRTIIMGTNRWLLVANTGTVWNLENSANLTLNAGTSNLVLADLSANTITFHGGNQTYNKLWFFDNDTPPGTATYEIRGNNTIAELGKTKVVPLNLNFQAGSTTNIGTWSVNGNSGNITTLTSSSTSQYTLNKTGGGTVTVEYANISYANASPANTWYVDGTDIDSGNNTNFVGWGPGPVFDSTKFFFMFA